MDQPTAKNPAAAEDPKIKGMAQHIIMAAMKVVYDPKGAPALVGIISKSDDPIDGLAQAAMAVLMQLRQQVKGTDPNTVLMLAPMILAMIAEVAHAAKVVETTPDVLNKALAKLKQNLQGSGQQMAPESAEPQAEESAEQPQAESAEQPPSGGLVADAMGG